MAQLNYRIDGAGPRLVLLHPIGLDLTFFDSMVAELAPHFQVLRVDMRGHGGSPLLSGNPTLAEFAEDLHTLMQELHFAPAAVAGFSFGGMVAQALTLNHPEDVSALISGACPATLSDEGRKAIRERGVAAERDGMAGVLDSTMERWFTPAFRERGGDAAARQRLLDDDVSSFKKTWNAIADLNHVPRLHTISVPALCLAAELDASATPAAVEAVAKEIPGAKSAVVPAAPHMLFIERPRAVAAVIAEFLGHPLP
jgi:3-oxoadipate enol-lactonase